jgi:hypothetical protein
LGTKKRLTKEHMTECLQVLANRLSKEEYAAITSMMSMLFIGHTFELSEDGFEFVNLSIKINKQINKKDFDLSRQDNIIKLKPN